VTGRKRLMGATGDWALALQDAANAGRILADLIEANAGDADRVARLRKLARAMDELAALDLEAAAP